jgi:hypothetical protein
MHETRHLLASLMTRYFLLPPVLYSLARVSEKYHQRLSTVVGAFYLGQALLKPIHYEAARFFWRAQGLGQLEVIYFSPVLAEHKLELVTGGEPVVANLAGGFNHNVKHLSWLLCGPQDYVVVERK